MKPGDIVVCGGCGAKAVATFSGMNWQDHYPVSITWTNGPHSRTEVTRVEPELCLWCYESKMAANRVPSVAVCAQYEADLTPEQRAALSAGPNLAAVPPPLPPPEVHLDQRTIDELIGEELEEAPPPPPPEWVK